MPAPKRRILLIDDDARVREMLRDVIRTFGYDVDIAEGGRTGLMKFNQDPVDLVITDVMMPGVSGLQLAAELRALHPTLPIILLTGLVTGVAVQEAHRLGLTILFKPIRVPALKAAIEAAIRAP